MKANRPASGCPAMTCLRQFSIELASAKTSMWRTPLAALDARALVIMPRISFRDIAYGLS
jgi:hypothetical protein